MTRDNRDSLDFATMNISTLYGKILFPTLIGMVASVVNIVADGAFVGHGVGSDGIAAINIITPVVMLVTGLAMMFGVGASVVASVHLSHGKNKAADINVTQAFAVSFLLVLLFSVVLSTCAAGTSRLLGGTPRLLPLATDYLRYVAMGFPFLLLSSVGLFIIRLDGSPRYAMMCSLVPALLNIGLDYLFIFPFGWGIKGAAIATAAATAVGGLMALTYMLFFSHTLHLYRVKLTAKSMWLTARNIGYQVRLGASAMIGELSVAVMMLIGNTVFMRLLGEDGVAAFGVACYCFPIVFMIGTAVATAAQPIISFNHGQGNVARVRKATRLMVMAGALCGGGAALIVGLLAPQVASLFIDPTSPACALTAAGLPLFATGFLFFALNVAFIGYFQSTERAGVANLFAILRGMVMPLLCFLVMPRLWGVTGTWLAVPAADLLVFVVLLPLLLRTVRREGAPALQKSAR